MIPLSPAPCKIVFDIALPLLALFFLAGDCLAASIVRIKIYPEHVGVFTTVRKQQFVAVGIRDDGSAVNITKNVDWKSSNANKVTINAAGLARIVDGVSWGQVKISCSYPKKVPPKKVLHGPYLLLLGELTPVPGPAPSLLGPNYLLLRDKTPAAPLTLPQNASGTDPLFSLQEQKTNLPILSRQETKPAVRGEYVTLP